MPDIYIYMLGGLAAILSTLSGSFAGGGASLILLPLLFMFVPGSYASLLTSTKVSALTMVLVAGVIHWRKHDVTLKLFTVITIFSVIGTAIGTYILQFHTDELLFKQILAATLLITAVYLLAEGKIGLIEERERKITHLSLIITAVYCLLVNILNGLFGGTGIFLTLFMVIYFRFTFIKAIAYIIFSYIVINILQTGYLLMTENVDPVLTIVIVFGSLIGGWTGTKLQYLKGNKWVKSAAMVLMVIIGVRVLFN